MKIGIIGGGNMARAIVLGLIANKTKPDSILVSDKDKNKLNDLKRFGIKISTDNDDALKHGDVIIFAVKPNIYEYVLPQCKEYDKLFISIAAGTRNVAVVIEGKHSCMTARGIKKPSAKTVTTTFRGRFEKEMALQNKLLFMIK